MEIISKGLRHAVVCEVRKLSGDSLDEFVEEILSNEILFDPELMELEYRSEAQGVLEINTKGKRRFNDRDINLDYPSFSSPYSYSKWDSGTVKLDFEGERIVWDVDK